jgi:Zn-dependent protease with chaperone function
MDGAPYRPAALASREDRHRRAVLLGFAALIVLSTSPVFGHHVAEEMDTLLAGQDHLGALCLTALHHLLAPVHYLFHLLIVAGLAYATWDRLRAWLTVRRALAPLEAEAPRPADPFWQAARASGIDPERLRIVSGLPNPAFTVGWFRPAVYVAAELVEWLTPDELAAVLAHERAHLARRDPLRLSVLRFLGRTLFWLPALHRLAADASDDAEITADDAAAAGRPLVLASAILALAHWRTPPALVRATVGISGATTVGFYRADLLDRRIRRLAGEEPPVASHVTRRSIAGAALALALVWTSGVLMAHPLPSERPDVEPHCTHQGEWAVSHLFCLGSPFGMLRAECPHVGR